MSFFTSREGSGMFGRAFTESNFIQSFFRSFNFCFHLLLSISLLVTNFCSYILTIILSNSAKKHYSSVITINPSSSSSSQPSSWDVFLSFCGKDTRAGFIAHLYEALDQAGIQTFRDDPALEKGDQISPALFKGIGSSNKFVVVLSENYAYSPWCLDELVEILSCKRTNNQVVVIPVFYYVNPTDVRYHKQSFAKAIDYHYQKKRYSDDMINRWRSALAEIAEISGYHPRKDANENEAHVIKKIVEDVTPPKVLPLDDYLFGIDSAVEEIYEKINMESNDVRAIGICGMGGIGKTTIAKAFFNKYYFKFEISCFIENAKQYSLLSLLEQLLVQLLRKKDYKVPNVESGIKVLQQILPFKKVLVVLDDLDPLELLTKLRNLFSPGSRVILTSRNAHLLNRLKGDISGSVDVYEVKELGEIESMKLFSYHAFRVLVPPESFKELSQKFVSYAEGLPLALKVLGSSLHNRTDVSFWRSKLEKVQEIPENKIQKILQLSYDELEDESEKAIFLDIVFFFVGKDKNEAVHVFASCHFHPDTGIPVLEERCLLTIDKNDKFQMHNLIQDMGRKVIREETKHGKCIRLDKTWDALQNIKGTDKIEVLILDLTTWTERHLSVKIFERMPNLRLLEIIGAHKIKDVKGNFKNSFHELRCIRWPYCPFTYLPSDFRPQHLVSLDMPYSKLKTMWKNTMPLTSLKHINISYSENLKRTPDFRDLKLVEKLLVRGCKNLLEVHPSIAQLSKLYYLDLGQCYNLKELCEPIGQLTELGHLDLHGCVNLERLPEPIKQLSNLGRLDLGHCRSLKRLPEQLGDMKGLKMIDVSHTAIEQLPNSIGRLINLVELKLKWCKKLKNLPEQLGDMEGLRKLDVSDTAIEQLPDSFGRLINLVDLNLGWCSKLTSLPNSIWKLKLLEVLNLEYCWKLERLPEQLEKMESASCTAIEEIPDSIGLLSSLRELNLSFCSNLESLPNSLRNLTSLRNLHLDQKDTDRINLADTVKNMKLESIELRCNIRLWLPIILSLSSLKHLTLWDDEGDSFSSTKPFSFSTLSNLQGLGLYNCTSLGSSFPELPLNLKDLWVQKYATLEQLPDLSSFKQLAILQIFNCISLQSLPPLPPHLVRLEVKECTSLQHVPDLSTLKELRTLRISGCSSNLKSVSLKESSLKVGGRFSKFKADLPNTEIPEWFRYKSSIAINTDLSISFQIPPILGDNFLGIALCLVYKLKRSAYSRYAPYIRAVIKNKTEGITNTCSIPAYYPYKGEVQSRIECIRRGDEISVKSGDIIKVSFHTLLYSDYDDVVGEVKVKMCGAHVIQKTPSTPC